MTAPPRATMHVAAVMRMCISASLTRTFSVVEDGLAGILTAPELRRATETVNAFALVATYSSLTRRVEEVVGPVSTDDFYTYWAMAFKIASERAELSRDAMEKRWSSFNTMLKRYITLWHAVPPTRLQKHGVQFWAQSFFADDVVQCPINPPLAMKERHGSVVAAAGSVVQDVEQVAEKAFSSFVVTRLVEDG